MADASQRAGNGKFPSRTFEACCYRGPRRWQSRHSLFKLRPLGTLVALALGYQVAFADEAGVSIWLPGTFGSLAAAPVQPGLQWPTTYYKIPRTRQSSGGQKAIWFIFPPSRSALASRQNGWEYTTDPF